jgi:hypothetical protein
MKLKPHSWQQKIKKHRFLIIITGIIVTILLFILLAVWRFGWGWTGFNGGYSQITTSITSRGGITTTTQEPLGKTLWDWLNLLGVLAIPVVVGLGAAWFTSQQGKVSDRENTDNQRETALQSYIDKMSELLLTNKLRESDEDSEVRKIARVRTLTVLPRLDGKRKGSVLQFLYELSLLYENSIISLEKADLRGADLRGADLEGIDLSEANLEGATLEYADLIKAHLEYAHLRKAHLEYAHLREAHLEGVDLREAHLKEANLKNANLESANLSEANLEYAYLEGINLSDADMSGANLKGIIDITIEELEKSALSLKGATMPDGSIHP